MPTVCSWAIFFAERYPEEFVWIIGFRELKPEDNRRIEYIIRTCLVEFGADHAGHRLG